MGVDVSKGHQDMDYNEHMRTYKGFLKASVGLIVGVVALLAGMFYFLVP